MSIKITCSDNRKPLRLENLVVGQYYITISGVICRCIYRVGDGKGYTRIGDINHDSEQYYSGDFSTMNEKWYDFHGKIEINVP